MQERETEIVKTANAITIASQADLEEAGEFLRNVATQKKLVVDTFKAAKSAAHNAHREITGMEKKFLDPLKKADDAVRSKVVAYNREQEEKRREEQRRLDEEARKAEEERRIAHAEQLEAQGEPEAAEQVLSAPIQPPAVIARPAVEKVAGISMRETWKFEIVDESAIPREYMTPDTKAIDNHARSMKSKAGIPGVRFYPEKSVSARSF